MDIDVAVRRAGAKDIAPLAALFVALDEHHFHLRPELFKALTGPARNEAVIGGFIDSDRQVIFVAEARDRPEALAGLVHVLEREIAETIVAPARRVAEVDAMVVTPERRGGGIARRLLDEAEAWARARQLVALELNVRGFNAPAFAAYQALGFEPLAHRMGRTISY